jgi:4-hydroxybenzoyl-CoA thioesterase
VADQVRAADRPRAASGLTYHGEILIRFAHCDPAGIVFFPRYMEMFNNLVEDWCRDELDISFADLLTGRGFGLPTVHLDVDFVAPSTIGETLSATLRVLAVGTSSIRAAIVLRGPDGNDRVRAETVLVLTDPRAHRAVPIPDDLRRRLAAFRVTD